MKNILSNPLIDSAVKQVTGVDPEELAATKRRINSTVLHISMFFYLRAGYGPTDTGKRFNRDHATAYHARNNVEKYYGQKAEKKFTEYVDRISELTRIQTKLPKES